MSAEFGPASFNYLGFCLFPFRAHRLPLPFRRWPPFPLPLSLTCSRSLIRPPISFWSLLPPRTLVIGEGRSPPFRSKDSVILAPLVGSETLKGFFVLAALASQVKGLVSLLFSCWWFLIHFGVRYLWFDAEMDLEPWTAQKSFDLGCEFSKPGVA